MNTATTLPQTLTGTSTTWCWGYNGSGQLGSSKGAKVATPTQIPGIGFTLFSIGGGYLHTCGTTTAGNVFCWGSGAKGQLGNGAFAQATSPQWTYTGGGSVLSVGYNHACSIKWSGVVCWGDNSSGQLGNGTTTMSSAAVAVLGL